MRKVGAASLMFLGALALALGALARVLATIFDQVRELLAGGAEAAYAQAEELETPVPSEPAKFFRPVQVITSRVGSRISEVQP